MPPLGLERADTHPRGCANFQRHSLMAQGPRLSRARGHRLKIEFSVRAKIRSNFLSQKARKPPGSSLNALWKRFVFGRLFLGEVGQDEEMSSKMHDEDTPLLAFGSPERAFSKAEVVCT